MEIDKKLKKDWMPNIQSFFIQSSNGQLLFLFLLGCLNVLSYAPFGIWPVIILTLSILILMVNQTVLPMRGLKLGLAYGLGWFATGLSWVHVAIADFGGFPTFVSVFLLFFLDSYLALFPALACYLSVKFKKQLFGLSFVLFWLVAEALRGWFLTGFPWLSVGYSQTSGPLMGFAPIFGEFGIQFLILLTSCFLAMLYNDKITNDISRRTYIRLGLISAIFVLGGLLNQITWHSPIGSSTKLALIQGNIEQSVKWQPENEAPTMQKYLTMSMPHFESSDIIIWPEAAIPKLEVISGEYLQELDRYAAKTDTALITGIVDFQPETSKAFNNIVVLGKKNSQDEFGHYKYLHNNRFNKHHLLPIGEFVPFESILRTLGPLFDLPMSSFSRGEYVQDNLIANGINISPAICFEVAFSDQVRSNIYLGDAASHIILTVSNDAWFGNSHGPWQHLQIAQMRAIEYAKPVVRVTNNGVTAIIDEAGTIIKKLAQFEADVLTHELPLTTATTPYYQFGNLPIWLALLFLSILSIKKPAYKWRVLQLNKQEKN